VVPVELAAKSDESEREPGGLMDPTPILESPARSKRDSPKAASDAVRERFRPFETAPTAMLLVDRQGTILLTNERLDRVFGYHPGELSGLPVEVLTPAEVRERHAELREAFFDYPATRQMGAARDLFGVSKDGRHIPVEIGLTSFEVEGERLVLAFVLDLTERRKQEEKFRLVVEAAPNGMLMVDVHGCIVLANGQACTMFGYSRQELRGQPVEVLLPERFRHKHQVYRGSFTQAPASRSMGAGRELLAQRKDGSEFPIEIGLTPIDAHDGRFVVSTLIDITERKRIEEEIRLKNAQLSRLNDELTNFAYSVSHDLKAPLTAIQGLTRIALEDLDANEVGEAQVNLKRIIAEADKLKHLIEDVLVLAKSDTEQEAWTPTRVSDIVGEVVESYRRYSESQGVELRTDLAEGLVLFTQPTRLRLIVENLISNAIRYADPEKPQRFVEVRFAVAGAEVELRVRDNGLGIPAECHGQVFGMFRRFHPNRTEGSGLGLALVKKEVLRLGGTIEFESSPAGTAFHVQLPTHDEQHAQRNHRD
jgi:PAS domain S-box-containing protein